MIVSVGTGAFSQTAIVGFERDEILRKNRRGLAASSGLLFVARFIQGYPNVTGHRAFPVFGMLFQIFLNDLDNFLVWAMLRAQYDGFICKLNVSAPGFFGFFLAESKIIVPGIQNTTDVSDSFIGLELQPAVTGDCQGRLYIT